MKFPSSEHKEAQYAQCGYMLADAVSYAGYPIPGTIGDRWANFMYRLATADTISEDSPELLKSGEELVNYLEIVPSNEAIVAANGLLAANQLSINSKVLSDHLNGRRDEALESAALLKSITPEITDDIPWQQVNIMSLACIYLDSLADARDDAKKLSSFTASQLAIGSGYRFLTTVGAMKQRTRSAVIRSSFEHGFSSHIIRRLPKKLLALSA